MEIAKLSNRIVVYSRFHPKPSSPTEYTIFVRFHVIQNDLEMHETLVSTRIKCPKIKWKDTRVQEKKYDDEAKKANTRLNDIETAINDFFRDKKKKPFANWREVRQCIDKELRTLILPKVKGKANEEEKQRGSLQHLKESYLCERTVSSSYQNKFDDLIRLSNEFFGENLCASQFTKKNCREFSAWMRKRMTHNSVSTYMNKLRTLLLHAEEIDFIQKSPIPRKGLIKGYRPGKGINLTDDELLLYNTVKQLSPSMERMKNLFLFMCSTGLGLGDIRTLRKRHFVEIDGERFIDKERNKSYEQCLIPLSSTAQRIYDGYFNWMDSETGIVTDFEPFEGIPSDSLCLRKFKELAQMAGIKKDVGTYTPRRTFATNYIRNGGTMYQLQKIMGHRDIRTTLRYVTLAQNDLARDASGVYKRSKFHNQ